MRVNDVFVIMPYDNNKVITDIDLYDAYNDSNVSLSLLQKEEYDNEYFNKVLGRYVDGYVNAFTFKKDYKEIAFRELFLKFKKECEELSFEDFCRPFYLSTVSNDSPVIACYHEETGITVGILEDFLRMPDFIEQTTFKMVALFSRHT